MQTASALVLLVALSGASAFMAPGYAGGRLMLRSGGVKSVSAVRLQRKVQVSAVKMQEGGGEKEETYEEITARVKEEERQRQQKMQEMMAAAKQDTPYTDEEAKLYYQQNSGAGYRKNSQDGLLFAMGGMILLIPFVAVGIAIGTGYIPLDYLR